MDIELNIKNNKNIKNDYKELFFDNFFETNSDFFNKHYKPGNDLIDYIKTPKDLFYISLIITFFGYDGEENRNKGFIYFWDNFNLQNILIKDGKIHYNLDEIKDKFYCNSSLITQINNNQSWKIYGSHIYNIWKSKFELNYLNGGFKKLKNNEKENLKNHEIFIIEILFILKNIDFNNLFKLKEYNFDLMFNELFYIKNNNSFLVGYSNTFFFDYIKVINSLNKGSKIINFEENTNILLSKEKLSFFKNSISDIKRGIKRIMGNNDFTEIEDKDIDEVISLFLNYMDNKYKNNDEYKKLTTYMKFIYIENSLCFLGKIKN